MNVNKRSVSPPNALVLIRDYAAAVDIPATMGGGAVTSTKSCIAVGTREEHDGPTTLVVAHAPAASEIELPPLNVFDDELEFASGRVVVGSVLGDEYATAPVGRPHARVRVYTNDPTEPDVIVVLVECSERM